MNITAEIKDVVVEGGVIRVKVEYSDGDIQVQQYGPENTAENIQEAIKQILIKKNGTAETAESFKLLIGSVVTLNKDTEELKVEGPLEAAVKAIQDARPIAPITRAGVEDAALNVK